MTYLETFGLWLPLTSNVLRSFRKASFAMVFKAFQDQMACQECQECQECQGHKVFREEKEQKE